MRDKNSKFDIAIRDERGLLVYNSEHVRSFFMEKENALDDEYMEKFRVLFDRRDRGEISQDECNRLYEELWTMNTLRLAVVFTTKNLEGG